MDSQIELTDRLMDTTSTDPDAPVAVRYDVTPDLRKVAASASLTVVLAVALLALSQVPSYGSNNPDVQQRMGLMMAWQNTSKSPCTHMYDYACRGYDYQTTPGDTLLLQTARILTNELNTVALPNITPVVCHHHSRAYGMHGVRHSANRPCIVPGFP